MSEWEDNIRQAIVLADMKGVDKGEISAAFAKGLAECHSQKIAKNCKPWRHRIKVTRDRRGIMWYCENCGRIWA